MDSLPFRKHIQVSPNQETFVTFHSPQETIKKSQDEFSFWCHSHLFIHSCSCRQTLIVNYWFKCATESVTTTLSPSRTCCAFCLSLCVWVRESWKKKKRLFLSFPLLLIDFLKTIHREISAVNCCKCKLLYFKFFTHGRTKSLNLIFIWHKTST